MIAVGFVDRVGVAPATSTLRLRGIAPSTLGELPCAPDNVWPYITPPRFLKPPIVKTAGIDNPYGTESTLKGSGMPLRNRLGFCSPGQHYSLLARSCQCNPCPAGSQPGAGCTCFRCPPGTVYNPATHQCIPTPPSLRGANLGEMTFGQGLWAAGGILVGIMAITMLTADKRKYRR